MLDSYVFIYLQRNRVVSHLIFIFSTSLNYDVSSINVELNTSFQFLFHFLSNSTRIVHLHLSLPSHVMFLFLVKPLHHFIPETVPTKSTLSRIFYNCVVARFIESGIFYFRSTMLEQFIFIVAKSFG